MCVRNVSRRIGWLALVVPAVILSAALAHPRPSPYPVSWELTIEVRTPKRVVVDDRAYWYLTYSVKNETGQERIFLPRFEVLTPDGTVARADRLIPLKVFQTVQRLEGIPFLEQANQISGEIRLGEDEMRDGVAIWPEASAEDREFTVFFSGFSGEAVKVPGPDGELTLFKTLRLDYHIPGDAKFRQFNEVREVGRSFVMR